MHLECHPFFILIHLVTTFNVQCIRDFFSPLIGNDANATIFQYVPIIN